MPFSFGQVVYEGRSLYWGTRGHWEQLNTEDKCAEEAGAQALLRFLDEQSKTHPALHSERPRHD